MRRHAPRAHQLPMLRQLDGCWGSGRNYELHRIGFPRQVLSKACGTPSASLGLSAVYLVIFAKAPKILGSSGRY
jgi:hypothetical protein